MNGHIDYFIQSPSWRIDDSFQALPLVFCRFKKPYRPLAWKSSDLKVQSTLPLLGNDDIANGAMDNPQVHINNGEEDTNPTLLVRVVLTLNQ